MGYTQANTTSAQKAAARQSAVAAHAAWAASPTRDNAKKADDAYDAAKKAYGSFDMGTSGAAGGNYGGGCNEG